jgi:hypothetical protein
LQKSQSSTLGKGNMTKRPKRSQYTKWLNNQGIRNLFNERLDRVKKFFSNPESQYKIGKVLTLSIWTFVFLVILNLLDKRFGDILFDGVSDRVFGLIPEFLGSIAVYWILDSSIKQLFGIVEIPELPLSHFIEQIKSATRVRILETFTELANDNSIYRDFIKAVRIALDSGAEIQILLIHPDSDGAKQRADELSGAVRPISNVPELIDLTVARFYQLEKDELGSHEKRENLMVKLYKASPSIAMHMWDREAYISFFPVNRRSDKSPNLKVPLTTTFGQYSSSRFDELWEQKSSILLSSFMTLKVTVQNSTETFYYVREGKNTVYATCLFKDELFNNLEESSQIEIEVEERKYNASCSIIEPSDTKTKIIDRIKKRYDWTEHEQKDHIGLHPRIFRIEAINSGFDAK